MVDVGERWKIKYANGGKRVENEMRDNYQFILPTRASHFRSVSNTVCIPEDLGHGATGELVAAGVAFLTHWENFTEKFSAMLGFLSLPAPPRYPLVDFRAFSLNTVKMDLTLSWMGVLEESHYFDLELLQRIVESVSPTSYWSSAGSV
jgi:hypothetical protein